MHLLLIHQAFATMSEPGGTRHYEIGEHLSGEGHRLTVVASSVNYQTGRAVLGPQELGNTREAPRGLNIRRARAYAAPGGGFLARLFAFFSFMASSFFKGVGVRRVDVVWGTSPPIFQAVTAYVLARWKRVPFVLEVRDL